MPEPRRRGWTGRLDPVVARARTLVREALADLPPGSRLVVGVSGGADSLALAVAASFVARADGHDLQAVVVDHQLQPKSADVARRAVQQLLDLQIPARVEQVVVDGPGGPEAAARDARLAALTREPVDAVLLAHTLDDQAETVLLGLGRGSGPRSIAGMTVRAGLLRRPFLALTRAETEHLCTVHDLTWWVDPHNSDPSFRRVRVRHEAMPVLEEVLGGGVAGALARTAEQLRADLDHLDALAAEAHSVDVPDLAAMAPAIRSRVLRRAALDGGARPDQLAAVHLAELDRLVTDWHGQQRVELPGGVSCRRVGQRLHFVATAVAG